MPFFAQTRALAAMLWRFWLRRGVVGRRGAGAMRAPGVVARGLLVVLFASIGYAEGGLSRGNPRAFALFALGLFGYGWSVMASTAIVAVRGIIAPLDARLLDELPLREEARVVARALGQPQLFALAVVGMHAAAFERHHPVRDALFGALFAFASMVAGLASAHVARVFLQPMRIARLTVPLLVFGISSFILVAEAVLVARASWSAPVADAASPFVRGLVAGGHGLVEACRWLAVVAVAMAAIAWAERAGFDRVDAVPTKRYRRAGPEVLTLARVDRVLAAREPGARFVWIGTVYMAVCVAGTYAARKGGVDSAPLVRGVLLIASFLGFSGASARAARMAERDLVARALLAPLPILPGDLLAGKMAPIRRQAMTVVAPLLFLPWASASPGERGDVVWHVVAVLASTWIASGALASVAFVTSGAGGGPRAAMSTPINLERLLVLVPMLAVAHAPSVFVAAMQLVVLGLLAFEARKAARESVRWLDDQEEFSRETSVWRALLVLGAFVGLTSLSSRIVGVFHLDPVATAFVVYIVSAAALVVLTAQERGGLTSIPVWPERGFLRAAVVSVACGFGVGALAVLYARFSAHLVLASPAMAAMRTSALAAAAFVFAAPIAEELFFRGWLLDAIGREYSARTGAFAVVMTAFAFASIQPPVNVAPALVFGLTAGTLARRYCAVGPGIVAHVIVNAMSLFCAR